MKRFIRKTYRYIRYLTAKIKLKCKVHFIERPKKAKPNASDFKLNNHINLFYWKMSEKKENLGDYLSKVVVTHFMPKEDNATSQKDITTLFSTGSILGFRCQDATVWGSGIMLNHSIIRDRLRFSKLDIRAVRGPETRKLLLEIGKDCPEIYGDPAILMPLIFMPENITKKYNVSVVLHHEHKNYILPEGINCNFINIVTDDYETFITQILESELVISSSLHGIILAESYGVPAIFLAPPKPCFFKYEDWYHSTGRYDIVIANSIAEALVLEPMPLPDMQEMQQKLLQAFPSDLWE